MPDERDGPELALDVLVDRLRRVGVTGSGFLRPVPVRVPTNSRATGPGVSEEGMRLSLENSRTATAGR